MKGLFITFEGNDGSGKSSCLERIMSDLKIKGYDVVLTREPGGSKIAEQIRKVILDTQNLGMDPKTEALLYAASRRENVIKTIVPSLEEGKIVLCDRYIDSSLAYQGFARNIGIEEVEKMNQFATDGLYPSISFLFCVKPEIGLNRISKNRNSKDRLELEKIDFHNKVYDGYMSVAEKYHDRIVKIDGEKNPDEVYNDVTNILYHYIEEHYNEN